MDNSKYTLYINNLNDNINFNKLKSEVHSLFSKFGIIIKLYMRKNILSRGQAFITYDNEESPIKAIEELKNYRLFNKIININFSKKESFKACKLRNIEILKEKKNLIFQPKINEKKKILNENIIKKEIEQENKNNIWFIKNLPKNLELNKMIEIFEYYEGFKEVRYFAPKNIAFIEFEKIIEADYVKNVLNNKKINSEWILDINFAKNN